MTGIRLLDNKPQYRLADGTLAALGAIYFFESGTTTPKDVYGEPGLSTNLGSIIFLDADGRHSEDVHLNDDAAYRIDVRDVGNASIPGYPLDNVGGPSATGSSFADPADGSELDVLRNDGLGGTYWDQVRELADSTGHDGDVWYGDGEGGGYYAPLPAAATVDVPTVDDTPGASGSVILGSIMIQWGSDTAPSAAALTTTKAVTFGAAFGGTPYHIGIEPVLSGGVSSNSPSGRPNSSYSSPSTTGFTAGFFVGEENNGGTDTISSSIPFTYVAIGPAPA